MKNIFIFGLAHSGTTILRTIIGHIPRVYTVLPESDPFDFDLGSIKKDYEYLLFKNPLIKKEYFNEEYENINKIFIIRNPLFLVSSLNKRHGHLLFYAKQCSEAAKIFLYYQNLNTTNLSLIKYEDMFKDNFNNLKRILKGTGLNFSDLIFDNKRFQNISHKNQKINDIPKSLPGDKEHENLRFYQVNQEFKNNNDISKIYLSEIQVEFLLKDPYINQLYDIKEIVGNIPTENIIKGNFK